MTALRDATAAPAAPASWPFTPIEELDHYLENAHEPSLVQLETHAPCHLDRAALEAALVSVLAADPAARRHLATTSRWGRRLHWHAAAPATPAGRHPDPDEEAGLLTVAGWSHPDHLAALRERLSGWPMPLHGTAVRVILAVGPEHDVVIVQTHHAAFDGISSLALLTAICAAYQERAAARPGIRRETAPPPVADPGQPGKPDRSLGGQASAAPSGSSRRASPRLPGAVTRIAAHAAEPDRPGYGFVLRSAAVPRPPRQGSGPYPTVNDLLVAALILTVDRWNAAHGRRSGQIRIAVPVNDREPRRRWEGPGNQSRLIRVTTRPRQRTDPASLLGRVAAQTRAGKRQPHPGLDAMSRLLAAGWAPTVIKRHTVRLVRRLARPVCTDTSLLSNLGILPDPPCFTGRGLQPLWFSGPAPMPRGLSVGAVTVADRLHLCVHYRPALLDSGAAEAFTAAYGQALAELAGLPQRRPP